MKKTENKILKYWYGVEVSVSNPRICGITSLDVVDLRPTVGKWPDGFWAAKSRVPASLLRKNYMAAWPPYYKGL